MFIMGNKFKKKEINSSNMHKNEFYAVKAD